MIYGSLKKLKHTLVLLTVLLLSSTAAWAGGPPAPSIFNNTMAVMLIVVMILLLIVIGILGNILLGAADMKLKSRKQNKGPVVYSTLLLLFMLPAGAVFGQDVEAANSAAKLIGGMPASTFYLMITVIFLELALVIVMLINIRLLIAKEKQKIIVEDAVVVEDRKMRLSWWDKMNRLRPVSQEAELDLGHEYDGIRELNNKLPPWWLYGFYLTIIFAGVYMWRFHISHNGPSSQQEYEMSVMRADLKIKEYLKAKGDAVDENTVTTLTATEDLAEGKAVYMKSCASCHTETGAGNVGPNLTDDFWMHGNDIKSVFKTIRYGINAMPQWQNTYSNKQMAQVASYVKSLRGSNPPNAKAPQGIEMKEEEKASGTDSVKVTKSSIETVKQ